MSTNYSDSFMNALEIGRPPNIKNLFPHSKALLVSGKFIDRALRQKGKCMTIAANGRNSFVIRGALLAAQKANAAIIIEIARSEGGTNAYCAVNLWNMARITDAAMNELGITIPVAIHADHFGIKSPADIKPSKEEIVSLFDAGITSIAIDASHMPDDQNLMATIELNEFVPDWAGLETEVGEIKGTQGLSTKEEALFLIQGLNAYGIFPDWIALNNGSTHGLEQSGTGIDVSLTSEIHKSLEPYGVSGAQHGTSGNSSTRLNEIATQTNTTKANVATALQMVSWGLQVNDYGNAIMDKNGQFVKEKGKGVSQAMWEKMLVFANENSITGGNFKKLNLPFDNWLLAQSESIRNRMVENVEKFIYKLLTEVFHAQDTANIVIDSIIAEQSHFPSPKASRIEDMKDWTKEKIQEKASLIISNEGPEGDFDD